MNFQLDKQRPICPQIEENICAAIARGELKKGEKLPSVRETAVAASVNPNTVQKAFEELEKLGLLVSKRGLGWFVSEDTGKSEETVKTIIHTKTREYLNCMKDLGLGREEVLLLIKEWDK